MVGKIFGEGLDGGGDGCAPKTLSLANVPCMSVCASKKRKLAGLVCQCFNNLKKW
jgi:hypothetical protein